MLYSVTASPKTLLTELKTKSPSADMAFSCANCGLCAEVCPKDIDFGEVFTASKEVYAHDKTVMKKYGYGGVIFHQKSSFSPLFSATKSFHKGAYTHMAFMPGCALSAYSPKLVHDVFSYLRSRCQGIGMIQQCCGTPTRMMGDMAQFGKYHTQLENDLSSMHATTVVTACENCYMSLKQYAPHIKTISLYSLLVEIGLPKSAIERHKLAPTMALHDPCPTRYEKEIHDDVRVLLKTIGLPYEEFKHNREKTLCCGSGGMLELSHPSLARIQMKTRAEQTKREHIVSYCQSCAESMSKGGKTGVHLLDLIFNPTFSMKQEEQGFFKKWFNRFKARWAVSTLEESSSTL